MKTKIFINTRNLTKEDLALLTAILCTSSSILFMVGMFIHFLYTL